jgi:hypothetical protein
MACPLTNGGDIQQVRLVRNWFSPLNLRRFQIDLAPPIAIDDPAGSPELTCWGELLAEMILNDQVDDKVHDVPGVPEAAPA